MEARRRVLLRWRLGLGMGLGGGGEWGSGRRWLGGGCVGGK